MKSMNDRRVHFERLRIANPHNWTNGISIFVSAGTSTERTWASRVYVTEEKPRIDVLSKQEEYQNSNSATFLIARYAISHVK